MKFLPRILYILQHKVTTYTKDGSLVARVPLHNGVPMHNALLVLLDFDIIAKSLDAVLIL